MKKHLFRFLPLFLLITACQKADKNDPFLIGKNHIGPLTKEIQVLELDSVFMKDSVVMKKGIGLFDSGNKIVVYEKGGTQLLVLKPVQDFDSTSTIGNIQIIDPRFKTMAGLSTKSTFGNIVENYTVSRIESTLDAIVVFIDEINAYVTIEKEELPKNIRNFENIEPSQIPETAKIEYFWIGWQ